MERAAALLRDHSEGISSELLQSELRLGPARVFKLLRALHARGRARCERARGTTRWYPQQRPHGH
ncbi:hypothetical protein CLV63_11219 [Murinocardiopsis flavida]|uniref:Transcriptional regulator n=1 Tax=Murinocardiopsis flavida TaxID=645275 RepID=A0A2P8DFZ4_9ACTN|nr:hypothetical protein CLV63_11219 [Murinocardiopsis flavida]